MEKIAVLGPAGTFSDVAAEEYMRLSGNQMEPVYFPTIDDVIYSMGELCDIAVVPIENTLDGYVQRTLDLLLEMDIKVTGQIIIPVRFSLTANAGSLADIQRLYVQFKANGQCRNVIKKMNNLTIETTESNMDSYYAVEAGQTGDAAIVPYHMVEKTKAPFIIDDVTDTDSNYTRFIIIKTDATAKNSRIKENTKIRVPLYILPEQDHPGMLYDILSEFNKYKINLVSIMSRPTKKDLGTYNFFMETEVEYAQKEDINHCLQSLNHKFSVKILGKYSVYQ